MSNSWTYVDDEPAAPPSQGGGGWTYVDEDPAAPSPKTKAKKLPDIDGISAIRSVFPNVPINDNKRDPSSPLGMANPSSYHNYGRNAVDIPAIPGMTFEQAKKALIDKGYTLAEAIDEYNNPSAHATGGHWHFVFGGAPTPAEAPKQDSGSEWEYVDDTVNPAVGARNQRSGLKEDVIVSDKEHGFIKQGVPQGRMAITPDTPTVDTVWVETVLDEGVKRGLPFEQVERVLTQKYPDWMKAEGKNMSWYFNQWKNKNPVAIDWYGNPKEDAWNPNQAAPEDEIVVTGQKQFDDGLSQYLGERSEYAYRDSLLGNVVGGVMDTVDPLQEKLGETVAGMMGEDYVHESAAELDWRRMRELEERIAKSPWTGTVTGEALGFGAEMAGSLGDAAITPGTYGKTVASRLFSAPFIGAGTDIATQGLQVARGTRDEIDPARVAMNAAVNTAFAGLNEGAMAFTNKYINAGAGVRAVGDTGNLIEVSESFDNLPKVVGRTRKGSPANQKTTFVSQIIARVTKGWTNAPNIVVYTNFAALKKADPRLALNMERDGATRSPGFYGEDGTVHVIADNIKDAEKVQSLMYHEALAHDGLAKEFGENLMSKMHELYTGNATLRRKANDLAMGKYGQAYAPNRAVAEALKKAEQIPNKGLRRKAVQKIMDENPEMAAKLAEEVLAKTSESGIITKSILDKLTVFFRDYARRIGFKNIGYSSREIKALLADAHARVISGEGTAAPSGTKYMFVGKKGYDQLEQSRREQIERDYANSPELRDYLLEDDNYEEAIRMAEAGEDPSPSGTIRQKTGWFKGPDGRWRTEISDKNARLKSSFDEVTNSSNSVERVREEAYAFLDKELNNLQDLIKILKDQGLTETDTFHDSNETFGILSRARMMLNSVLDGALVKGSLPEDSEGILRLAGIASRYEKGNRWDKAAQYLLDKLNESDIDFAPSGPRTLGDILDHPELFAAYPDAKNIKLEPLSDYDKAEGVRGWFNKATNSLSVDGGRSLESQLDTLIHEVQHYIQSVEGFAKGGSDVSVINRLAPSRAIPLGAKVANGLHKILKRVALRHDAYIAMKDDPLFAELKRVVFSEKEGDRLGRRKELEEEIFQKYFGTSKSEIFRNDRKNYRQMTTFITDYLYRGIDTEIEHLKTEFDKIHDLYLPVKEALDSGEIDSLKRSLRSIYHLPFDAYQHLFGEVEARDTANRRGMNYIERQDTTPYTSEADKIEPNDYIFDYGDDSGANSGRSYSSEDSRKVTDIRKARHNRIQRDNIFKTDWEPTPSLKDLEAMVEEGFALEDADARKAISDRLRAEKELLGPRGANDNLKYMLEDEQTVLKEQTVKKLMDHLKGVRHLQSEYAKAVAENRKEKVKAMGHARATLKGEKRFKAVAAALKGVTEKPQILPFKDKFTQREVNALFDVFNDNPRLSWFESFRASLALKKLLEGGELPTKSEIDLITRSEVLPKDFMKYALEARSRGEKLKDWTMEAVSLPRAIISSMDFSAPFRQGWFVMGRKQFWKNLLPMFKHFGSKEYHEMIMDDIVNHKYYDFAKESGLFLAELGDDIATREEMFMSKTADKIPLVAGTQRAYTGFLNKLRFDTFVDILEKYESMADPALRIDPETDAGIEIGEGLARYINNATGRGTGIPAFEKAAPFLTGVFFSPRLMASRLNILFGRYNPVMWWNLHPVVRKEVAADYLKMSAITATVLGLAKYAGADVEDDPRSSDFSKIRIDGLRYDIMGGFGQYFTAAARILPAMTANAGITERAYTKNAAGQLEVLGKGGNKSGWDVFLSFMRNKLAPFPGYLATAAAGEDPVGKEFHAGWDAYGAVAPLLVQDMIEAGQKDGFSGLLKTSPAILGFGVSEYERFPGEYDAYGRTIEEVDENDPVTTEMDRLTRVKDLPKPLVALATDKSLPEELPEEMKKNRKVLEEYQRVSGQYIMADLRQTMQTEEWSKMTDEEKYKLVQVILRDQRANARDALFGSEAPPLNVEEEE